MAFNFSNVTKDLKDIGSRFSNEFSNEFLPMAQRTSRKMQERMGQIRGEDISQLPQEYLELAEKCNKLEKLYKNVLKVTGNYDNESYDYPTNLQESFSEFSKNLSSRLSNLSKATSPAAAQEALINSNAGQVEPPKTFYHALARATSGSNITSDGEQSETLVKGLDLYSSNLTKIANGRLNQDQLIRSKFNSPFATTLRQWFAQSNNIQRSVEEKRLDYDLARLNLTNCSNPAKEPQLRTTLENAEDDFANTVEDAVSILQNVASNVKPLEEILELAKAQLAYHKLAAELLDNSVVNLEGLVKEMSLKGDDSHAQRESEDFDI